MKRGACADQDGIHWFTNAVHVAEAAIEICMGCEVREQCQQYAIETDQRHGIWGGLTEVDLKWMRRYPQGTPIRYCGCGSRIVEPTLNTNASKIECPHCGHVNRSRTR